jgi:hypothetical protein
MYASKQFFKQFHIMVLSVLECELSLGQVFTRGDLLFQFSKRFQVFTLKFV